MASLALFCLMALTFSDVLLRSSLNAPIEAATELTRLLMAVIVFSALPSASWRGEHISVDLLDGLFRRLRLARIRNVVIDISCGVMLAFPARRIFDLAERSRGYGDQTEYLNIPTFYIEYFIAISASLTAGMLVLRGLAQAVDYKAMGRDA